MSGIFFPTSGDPAGIGPEVACKPLAGLPPERRSRIIALGTEDDENLTPAVALARAKGTDVHGPIPGDSVYRLATLGQYDAVIAQYHDQGHIPIKMVAFDTAVDVSYGLPFDRETVDHGTAYEIAGKNVADHTNMLAAIAVGEKLIETQQSEAAREPY